MCTMLIGRKEERRILEEALKAEDAQFIAIYRRRRVGKTYLISETYGNRFTFRHSGLASGNLKEQLFGFADSLESAGLTDFKYPSNWLEAFQLLKRLIQGSYEKKKIIFLDELSWMDTPKSDFMIALESFWNGWASARNDIVLIVCASATSWMIHKVIHNKGGLYNRLTSQIALEPFTLCECEQFVQSRNLVLTRHQILQFYMIVGGVPYYWTFLRKGMSLSQNIDAMFFADNAPLKDEFKYLYAPVFKNPTTHLAIIRCLSKKKIGMTREEIIQASGLKNSGTLTQKLEELVACGFIRQYNCFGYQKKEMIYQLVDCFTLFYYQFMEQHPSDGYFWSNQTDTGVINTWHGLAFERVCLLHVKQMKQKLGISGVLTQVNAWHCQKDEDKGIFGSQIDLLIVRKDGVINLCEMKYSQMEYTVTKKDDDSMRRKMNDFREVTKTKYAIYPTLVTTFGVVENAYAYNLQSVITMDDLFAF